MLIKSVFIHPNLIKLSMHISGGSIFQPVFMQQKNHE